VDERYGHRAFAHGSSHTLDRAVSDVPGDENAWNAGLERERRSVEKLDARGDDHGASAERLPG
jgi:hypothetical protein